MSARQIHTVFDDRGKPAMMIEDRLDGWKELLWLDVQAVYGTAHEPIRTMRCACGFVCIDHGNGVERHECAANFGVAVG